jgi:ribosomal-protein-alanine N-acetyltransferase
MLINIQNASLNDIPRIEEVEKVCFPYDYWTEKSIEYAITHIEDTTYRYIFLKATNEDNILMGYIIATLVLDDCEIQNVAVDVPYRRNHIAEKLFAKLEEIIQGVANNVYLEVRKSNIPAQNLYEKLGFQIVGERKRYYDSPIEDAILMIKAL